MGITDPNKRINDVLFTLGRRIKPHLLNRLALRGFNQRQIEALALLSW